MEVRTGRGDGVCVIGAGPAGLATAAELSRAGIDFVCFDQRPGPGGVWSSEVTDGLTHAWPSLTLNSPRGWFELSDHPMPRTYPDFPRADQVSAYLEAASTTTPSGTASSGAPGSPGSSPSPTAAGESPSRPGRSGTSRQ